MRLLLAWERDHCYPGNETAVSLGMRLLVARGLAIVHMYSVYPHYKPLDTTRVIRRTITFLKTRWVAINSVQSAINDVRS